jgi:hypothetical protein
LPAISKISKSLYLFQVKKVDNKHSLTIAFTIKMNSEFLQDTLLEINDRKSKIWTLLNNVYVQWSSNVISAWKFKSALTNSEEEQQEEAVEDKKQDNANNKKSNRGDQNRKNQDNEGGKNSLGNSRNNKGSEK